MSACSAPALPRAGRAAWLGRIGHDEASALQHDIHARRVAGEAPDTLLLLEHDSVYTAGRAADPAHFLVPPDELERRGHRVRQASRGGDVTWHGPGQLVAYPILDLRPSHDVRRYLRDLEEVLVRTCRALGVAASTREGLTGAWITDRKGGMTDRKIGAIGVRVVRWVTLHGTALNVAPDLGHFDAIVACGIPQARVTSIHAETGTAPSVRDAASAYARCFGEVFGLAWDESLDG